MTSINSSPTDLPAVPLTLEGAAVLHQMFRVRWAAWKALGADDQNAIATEAAAVLGELEGAGSAAFSTLGHKSDLLLVHFRPGFDDLNGVELRLARTRLWDYLELAHSVRQRGGTGALRIDHEDLRATGRGRHPAPFRRVERGDRASDGPPAGSDAFAALPGDSRRALPLLLSYGPQARRGEELVHSCRWPSASGRCTSTA